MSSAKHIKCEINLEESNDTRKYNNEALEIKQNNIDSDSGISSKESTPKVSNFSNFDGDLRENAALKCFNSDNIARAPRKSCKIKNQSRSLTPKIEPTQTKTVSRNVKNVYDFTNDRSVKIKQEVIDEDCCEGDLELKPFPLYFRFVCRKFSDLFLDISYYFSKKEKIFQDKQKQRDDDKKEKERLKREKKAEKQLKEEEKQRQKEQQKEEERDLKQKFKTLTLNRMQNDDTILPAV